jgi:hypothetical protein
MFFIKTLTFTVLMLVITARPSSASLICQNVFKQNTPMDMTLYLGARLDQAQSRLLEASTLIEANDQVHEMVVTSNELLDNAIKAITSLNVEELGGDEKASLMAVAEIGIEKLQQTFAIDDLSMKNAITTRIQRLIDEEMKRKKLASEKRAIGFNRNESSKEFHANPPTPEPIGFDVGNREELAASIEEAVVYTEENPSVGEDTKQPIGFLRLEEANSNENTPHQEGMGFLPPKEPGLFEQNLRDLNQITFDSEQGEFVLVSETPVGF